MSKLPNTVAALLESSINRYLSLDPSIQNSVDALENKSVTLRLKEFSFPLFFKIDNGRIKVLVDIQTETDVSLSTTVPTLVRMTLSNDGDESVLGSELEMSGNMDVGRHFRSIFRNVDIDWEEVISRRTGDVIAHKLGNGVRQLNRWLGNTRQTFQKDITEYLQEESAQLPSGVEVSSYVDSVDEIRTAVERAEAKLKFLKNLIEHRNELSQPGNRQ